MLGPVYRYCTACRRRAKMITVSQAAKAAGVSARTIYRRIQKRLVHASRIAGEPLLVCQASLLGFEQSLEAKPNLSSADTIVNRAIELIQKRHADAELKLCDLAQELAISASRLSRLLKKGTGAGFREYLRAARLRKAAELLHKPGLSIKEIALAVGYKHVSDFDRHFKNAYGESPGEHRHRLWG